MVLSVNASLQQVTDRMFDCVEIPEFHAQEKFQVAVVCPCRCRRRWSGSNVPAIEATKSTALSLNARNGFRRRTHRSDVAGCAREEPPEQRSIVKSPDFTRVRFLVNYATR